MLNIFAGTRSLLFLAVFLIKIRNRFKDTMRPFGGGGDFSLKTMVEKFFRKWDQKETRVTSAINYTHKQSASGDLALKSSIATALKPC